MHVRDNLELARTARGLPPDDVLVASLCDGLGLTPLGAPAGVVAVGWRATARRGGPQPRREPVLAVLDEPTSQLDEANAEVVARTLVDAARRGCAVVVASHDPVLLDEADEVVDLGAIGVPGTVAATSVQRA